MRVIVYADSVRSERRINRRERKVIVPEILDAHSFIAKMRAEHSPNLCLDYRSDSFAAYFPSPRERRSLPTVAPSTGLSA